MRIKIKLDFNNELKLPIHYNHLIQGFIYSHISDAETRNKIHDEGYRVGLKKIKLMTFSRILGSYTINKDIISFKSPVELIFSSYYDDLLSKISFGLLNDENMYLNGTKINISDIKTHYFDEDRYKNIQYYMIEMVSPLTVYNTDNDGKKIFFSPWDPNFENAIRTNIATKLKAIKSDTKDFTFSIKPNNMKNIRDEKIVYFKDTLIKGYTGIYTIKSEPDIIKLLYNTGIGSKNSEGFGCFEILGDIE